MATTASTSSIQTRTDELLERLGVQAIVATSRSNVRHLSGVFLQHMLNWPIPEEQAFVVWAGEGKRELLVPEWCIGLAERDSQIPVSTWLGSMTEARGGGDSAIESLVRILQRFELSGVVGIELKNMTAADLRELESALPDVSFIGVDKDLSSNRVEKTEDELALVARAARSAELGMIDAIAEGHVGMTEREFSASLRAACIRNGADEVAWLALQWARFDQFTVPTDDAIKDGDTFIIEMGVTVEGYLADVQRTVAVGTVDPVTADLYTRLAQVHRRTLLSMVPGKRFSDLNREFLDDMAANDLVMWDGFHLGHGLGLDAHEGVNITEREDTVIPANSTYSLEPVIVEPRLIGIEDVVVVRTDSTDILSWTADWSQIPVLGQRLSE